MIITEVDSQSAWTCLVRRGMLYSECEAIEYWSLDSGEILKIDPDHGVDECLIILEGRLRVGAIICGANTAVALPQGTTGVIEAASRVRALSIRTFSSAALDRLPSRVPELRIEDRAI